MKIIKKTLQAIVLFPLAVLLLIAFLYVISPVINDSTASGLKRELLNLPLPEHTELCKSASIAGKIAGEGNGMQYLGAILLKSDLTIDQITAHYSQFNENGKYFNVNLSEEFQRYIRVRVFTTSGSEADGYYVIHSWGDGVSPFDQFDLRGY